MVQETVYIVDDDPVIREALTRLLESVSLRVEASATCEEFLETYDAQTLSCLILDARLPGMSGFELQEELHRRNLSIPVIMITGYGDVSMAVRAVANGALDYLTKPFNEQVLLERIRQALDIAKLTRERAAQLASVERRYRSLTPREQQVMQLVISGKPNKVVAAELGVSCKTVEGHRARVMEKMQAESLPELVRMGLMLEPDEDNVALHGGNRYYWAKTA